MNTLINDFYKSIIASILAGVGGTCLGAIAAILINLQSNKKKSISTNRVIKPMMGFASGVMISIICFDLVPLSLTYQGLISSIICMLSGCILMAVLELMINKMNYRTNRLKNGNRLKDISTVIFIGIALHNFPEGLALGAGFAAETEVSISLTFAIMLHNIPEGLALAAPLAAIKRKNKNIILISILTGAPTFLGAVFGYNLAIVSKKFIGASLGVAGGAMIYVVVCEMFPIIYEDDDAYSAVCGIIGGLMTGIILSYVL